jgi:hypothetical protein
MLLDNDFYMLVKRHLIPHPNSKYEKKFSSLLPFFIIAILAILFLPWCPVDLRRRRSTFWIFNWKSIRKVKQFRNNRTMLVLKITIRLLLSTKELQKTANFHTRRLYFDRMGNLVKSKYYSNRTSNNSKALLCFHYDSAPTLPHGARCRFRSSNNFRKRSRFVYQSHIKWYYYPVFGCRRIRVKWSSTFVTQHN